jgi:hypothetical protein
VTATDTNGDGAGDAILTFASGESVMPVGIGRSEVETPAQLYAMGSPSFTGGALIDAPGGSIPVRRLRIGDRVLTLDSWAKPIRWIGSRGLSAAELEAAPHLRPGRIWRGALGLPPPRRDLIVSPQHRVCVRSRIAERMFVGPEVLVAAKKLIGWDGIKAAAVAGPVDYWHIMFAKGAPTESFFVGGWSLKAATPADRLALIGLLPDLANALGRLTCRPARPFAKGGKSHQLVRRRRRKNMALLADPG